MATFSATAGAETKGGALWPFFPSSLPWWKRAADIILSSMLLFLLWPVFLLIAAGIKLSSPGPVFYRQLRVGGGGRLFQFIKFRTMTDKCNTSRHRNYLHALIDGNRAAACDGAAMIKLDSCNPDIFPFGRLLRRTYLDELPQLINVLRGEMSLVGPRPPIPYEVAAYGGWHNGRFGAIPGMTGLWQVSGKNRLTFAEMVRLDIRYSRSLSPMLDLKILLMTPLAVLRDLRDGGGKAPSFPPAEEAMH